MREYRTYNISDLYLLALDSQLMGALYSVANTL